MPFVCLVENKCQRSRLRGSVMCKKNVSFFLCGPSSWTFFLFRRTGNLPRHPTPWSSFSHRVISRTSFPRRHHNHTTSASCPLASCVNASPSTSARPESRPVRKKADGCTYFCQFLILGPVLHPFFDTYPDPRRINAPPLTITRKREEEKKNHQIECAWSYVERARSSSKARQSGEHLF